MAIDIGTVISATVTVNDNLMTLSAIKADADTKKSSHKASNNSGVKTGDYGGNKSLST